MLQTCVSAVFRFLQHCPLLAWTKVGVSSFLSIQFSRIGWLKVGPWTWQQFDACKTISLDPDKSAAVPDADLLSSLAQGFPCFPLH